MIVTKYITRYVIWINLFTLYVIHHIVSHRCLMTSQLKSQGIWVHLGCIIKLVSKLKLTNLIFFFFMIVTKYITRYVILINLLTLYVIHRIGITQRPHDHLVQKSRHLGATWVPKLVSKQKSTNLISFLYDCNQIHYQIGCMGPFVHIICNSLYCYHTEAS